MVGGGFTVLFTALIISLIAFTPLREYIPGYEDVNVRKNLIKLGMKTDSLSMILGSRETYMRNLKRLLEDSATMEDTAALHIHPDTANKGKQKENFVPASKADSLLRNEVETQNPYNTSLKENASSEEMNINDYFFFTPLKGIVVNGFNPAGNHYGVDIVSKENEAIKATLDGTVILSAWTLSTGNVIILQHTNNLLSVYAHNSVLLKKTGDNVKAGDVIAIVGNTGELTTGPHLHFELWYKGSAVNPQDYMEF
jgi:murein DD-endopeptidase MepM/ murein hydrolase activator NlpD